MGISGDRIEAIGSLPEHVATKTVIDAAGRALSPGFVDIHTHSDLSLVADGTGESKLRQGVTTEVVGNCSFAAFPIEPSRLELHADHLARVTTPLTPWWTDLDGYADALHEEGLAINVAPLAGHGTLRVAAMGVDQRPPTNDELARMKRDLAVALDQGAFGMSTGLTHVPSAYGSFDEVAALARVLASRGALYATHSRGSKSAERGEVGEAIDLGRATGVTVEFSHMAINDPSHWGMAGEQVKLLDEARDSGVDIFFDVYPYHASSSSLTQYLPPWVQAGGTDVMRTRLADPATRRRALDDMTDGWFSGIPWLWDRFVVSDSPDGYGVAKSLEELAAEAGTDPYELTLQLCERYGNRLQVVLFYRMDEDVKVFLAHPLAVVGSDGNAIPIEQPNARPHPAQLRHVPAGPRQVHTGAGHPHAGGSYPQDVGRARTSARTGRPRRRPGGCHCRSRRFRSGDRGRHDRLQPEAHGTDRHRHRDRGGQGHGRQRCDFACATREVATSERATMSPDDSIERGRRSGLQPWG